MKSKGRWCQRSRRMLSTIVTSIRITQHNRTPSKTKRSNPFSEPARERYTVRYGRGVGDRRRLADVPVWAFHSADDAIFDVANSDRLVASLRRGGAWDVVRYTRYDSDPENVAGSARGHTCGISASKLPEVYDWMLQIRAPG